MVEKTGSKKIILIVDDTALNRVMLADMLEGDYDILEAASAQEAMDTLAQRWTEISLVLLDVVMPGMDGFQVLAQMNRKHWIESVPVIMISADGSPENIDRAFDLGATDYITRPFDEKTVQRRAVNTINLYTKQKNLENMVTEQIMERERSNFQMVEILSNIVEFRNGESGLHVRHVRAITDILLHAVRRRCPEYGLTPSLISVITNASALHDIGKISIDEKILNKPGRLTPEEFETMKTHTVIGAKMLEETPGQGEADLFLHMAHDICRWHHERYDGRGYPDGLKGEEIPIAAQVVALADVYDALTATRVYKPAYPTEKAMDMILNGECGTFNPVLLECFQECIGQLLRELDQDNSGGMSASDIRRMAGEVLASGELGAANQTIRLLDRERGKNRFYLTQTGDILFEYDRDARRLTLSGTGAAALGLKAATPHPLDDEAVQDLGAQGLERIRQALEGTTALTPETQVECELTLPGGPRKFRAELCTLWDGEGQPTYTGVVGRLSALD